MDSSLRSVSSASRDFGAGVALTDAQPVSLGSADLARGREMFERVTRLDAARSDAYLNRAHASQYA